MHSHRFSISLVVIITTIVGIFAGITSIPTAQAALPNPIAWATKAPIPFATGQAAVVAGLDGRIYVIGGFSGGSPVWTSSAGDPRTNNWTAHSRQPTATCDIGGGSRKHGSDLGNQGAGADPKHTD